MWELQELFVCLIQSLFCVEYTNSLCSKTSAFFNSVNIQVAAALAFCIVPDAATEWCAQSMPAGSNPCELLNRGMPSLWISLGIRREASFKLLTPGKTTTLWSILRSRAEGL